jgi:hypothetical protein
MLSTARAKAALNIFSQKNKSTVVFVGSYPTDSNRSSTGVRMMPCGQDFRLVDRGRMIFSLESAGSACMFKQ